MQAAKDAVKNFTSKHGKHDTTVHERVAPAVTQETVTREQEDRVTTALDKEVHQDHYHTSVQPVNAAEVLPEQHHHRMANVEHKTLDHNDDAATKQRLQAEAAQFRDSSQRVEGQKTTSIQPVAGAEHVHHHVHETIQPVVNKQTIEPHVVHTTVPIHEVHHNAAQHHATSALPAVGINEFTKQGGTLDGRGERTDGFEGCPKNSHFDESGKSASSTTGSSGLRGVEDRNIQDPRHAGQSTTGTSATGTSATGTSATGTSATGTSTGTTSGNTGSTTQPKASLMDRLNPMKDSDHDGKKGLMD